MKMFEFRSKFHWSLFPRVQLTIFQHWFRLWLGAVQATSHYLNQWWLVYRRICVTQPQWVNIPGYSFSNDIHASTWLAQNRWISSITYYQYIETEISSFRQNFQSLVVLTVVTATSSTSAASDEKFIKNEDMSISVYVYMFITSYDMGKRMPTPIVPMVMYYDSHPRILCYPSVLQFT